MPNKTIPVGEYLFRRLYSLGISHVLGCPGDFNLTLLDHIYNVEGMKWVGCCNELNAAYASDGYTRVRGVPAALITTYGVGELSAMNGVAGAYAEHAGMIHIVGTTARSLQSARIMIHHTLKSDPDHTVYQKMSEPIRATSAFLTDETTMAAEIDRVIETGVKTKLPVYIFVPTDVVDTPVDAEKLDTPLNLKIQNPDRETENLVFQKIVEAIQAAKNPCVVADVLAVRHNARDLTRRIVKSLGCPAFSTLLSKGIIDETSEEFSGLYNGGMCLPGVREAVEEAADLVINIGPHLSDSNTGGFTRNIPDDKLLMLHPHYCAVRGEKFEGVHFIPVLERLAEEFEKGPSKFKSAGAKRYVTPTLDDSKSGVIRQSYLWQRLGRFTGPNDVVFTEAGTAQFGMPDAPLAKNVQHETQVFWSSIGYTVGATLGALIAAREMKNDGRVILVVGDGSLHMTVQEIGTYIRNGLTPTIFLINNDGYTIEREIHGPEQQYNDISPNWDYQSMLSFFARRSDPKIKWASVQAKTVEELEKVLTDPEFVRNECIQLCEIFVEKFDVPWLLRKQVDLHKARIKAAKDKALATKGAGMAP